MPGLSQLQKFNADLLNLGDEVKIRSARGEKPVTVSIPSDVEDRDDVSAEKYLVYLQEKNPSFEATTVASLLSSIKQ